MGHEINTILVQNIPFQRTSLRQGPHRRLGEQPREVQMGQAKRAGKGKGGVNTHVVGKALNLITWIKEARVSCSAVWPSTEWAISWPRTTFGGNSLSLHSIRLLKVWAFSWKLYMQMYINCLTASWSSFLQRSSIPVKTKMFPLGRTIAFAMGCNGRHEMKPCKRAYVHLVDNVHCPLLVIDLSYIPASPQQFVRHGCNPSEMDILLSWLVSECYKRMRVTYCKPLIVAVLGRQNTCSTLFEQVLKANPGPESCLRKIAEVPADLLHLIRAQSHKPFSSCHWINTRFSHRKVDYHSQQISCHYW